MAPSPEKVRYVVVVSMLMSVNTRGSVTIVQPESPVTVVLLPE